MLAVTAAVGGIPELAGAIENAETFPDPDSMAFLRGIAEATVKAAHVPPGAEKTGGGVNTTGIPLITPGGNYPAFWIRDYAMSLDCGLISPREMLPQLKLIARGQSGRKEKKSPTGCIVPAFSIADHIRMDGNPIFYPSTNETTLFWGCEQFGPLPPADDHYYFIHIAWAYWRDTKEPGFLLEEVDGLPMIERLMKAFDAPDSDAKTGAAVSGPKRRAVGFGFEDSVYMTGAMCFATLLRWRAAKQLVELCEAMKRSGEAKRFEEIAGVIASNIVPLFGDPAKIGGWLLGATEKCRQPDVWATLFALHLGVLPEEAVARARATVAEAVRADNHIIEYQGAVRHVPTTHNFSAATAWEQSVSGMNTYQNGAYWHTPTGWLIEALRPVDPALAKGVFERYIAHLKNYDFRDGEGGAPWECFGIGLAGAQNPVYMTSVTLPLSVLQKMNNANI